MKTLLLILLLTSQPVHDLGTVSQRRGIFLQRSAEHDFTHWRIELAALSYPSNVVSFVTTNQLLRIEDFLPMPPGWCVLVVRTVCEDGSESDPVTSRVFVRREPPARPKLSSVQVMAEQPVVTLTNLVASVRAPREEEPPTPAQREGVPMQAVLRQSSRLEGTRPTPSQAELPGGTNIGYRQMQLIQAAQENGKRRSE